MSANPTDPGAIDLEPIKRRNNPLSDLSVDIVSLEDASNLIAAVEALREDLAGYETVFNLAQKREHPWIEAWRKATSKPDTLPDYGEMLGWLFGQIEAVEARWDTLFEAIRHGDPEHQGWIKQTIANHRADLPVEPPRGKGNRERAEAAEAREVALAGVLVEFVRISKVAVTGSECQDLVNETQITAEAALAATPADVMEQYGTGQPVPYTPAEGQWSDD